MSCGQVALAFAALLAVFVLILAAGAGGGDSCDPTP